MKTNVDFNSPQEDGIFRPKERKKENENKNENNSRFNNTNRIIEENDEKVNVTIAGLPKKLGKYINFDNFKNGLTITKEDEDKEHKLTFKHVPGGVLLVDTDFTIK